MRDLVNTAILLGVLQGAGLALVLWARGANQLANRILAVLVAGITLMLLLSDIERRWGFDGHPHVLALSAPLPFLFGPLLYLYAISLTRPVTRVDPRWLAHALPFVADVLYMGQAFYLKSGDEKLALARLAARPEAPISLQVVATLEVVQALVYLLLTWRALERYGRKMQGYFSDLTRIDLRWLKALVLAHLGVWSVVLVSTVLRMVGHPAGGLGPVVQLGGSFAIFLTGYVSLWQPELAQKASAARVAESEPPSDPPPAPAALARDPIGPSQPSAPTPDAAAVEDASVPGPTEGQLATPAPTAPRAPPAPPAPPPRYQRNRLDDTEAEDLVAKLEALMTSKHLYREPGLTLPTLADALGITPHMLSQILNVRVGKSFFAYVNAYRAEALKEALADPGRSGRGVLELAFEVGFSSKSTLNSSFKKHTGMTPTEFRARSQLLR